MEHRLDAMLAEQDRAYDAEATAYGWDKAEFGKAFVNATGDVVFTDEHDDIGTCNRLATAAEAEGTRLYWRMNFITR